MSDVLVGAGEDFSIPARGTVTVNSEDSTRPRARLHDGRQSLVYRAAAAIADLRIVCDGDLLKGAGTFEGGITGWTDRSQGAGFSIAEEGSIVDSGLKAIKLITAGVSGEATATKDVWVRAGERITIAWRGRGDGTLFSRLQVFSPRQNQWVTAAGAWDATRQDIASQQAALWAGVSGGSLTFTMPPFSVLRVPRVPLRIYLTTGTVAAVGAAYADNVFIWPSWDFFSLHATMNLGPLTPKLQSSTDGAAWTTRGTGTIYVPSFWHRLAAVRDERWSGLLLEGTNHEAIEAGELVIGRVLALSTPSDMGHEIGHLADVVSNETPSGEKFASARSRYVRRTLGMRFAFDSDAAFSEARDEVFQRCLGPLNHLVIVPDSDKSEVVHGTIDRSWRVRASFVNYYDENDLTVAEDPFPPDRS